MTPGQACVGCARPMVSRRNPRPEGYGEHRGHGLCQGCYDRARYPRQPGVPYQPDEIAVERALLGDRPTRLHHTECRAAVDILTKRGMSATEIAQRIRVTARTVTRHRARLRSAA